ncbi:Crp/Fnr family transcriptional regulator [Lacimonas salitolerans]|uniref:Crp/Fnr family transcriptional regulator n=1 Tax=Lacimonas salitolerans TaxID=1323750 RepID=A0ABW4EGC8_9RHOB
MKNSIRFPHLKSCLLFDGLDDQYKSDFLDGCSVRVHSTAEEILTQGETPLEVFIIAAGSVEISSTTESCHRAIITHLTAGETAGEPEMIAQVPCVANAVAQPNTVTLVCPRADFMTLMRLDIMLRNIFRAHVWRMERENQFKVIDQFLPVGDRITSYLLHLSEANRVLHISQSYLASVAGCSRQTVNKVLKRFKDEGAVAIRKEEIQVLKPDKLRESLHKDN